MRNKFTPMKLFGLARDISYLHALYRANCNACPGFYNIGNEQTNYQGNSSNYFKIYQRFATHTSNLFHISCPYDPGHDRKKNDGSYHHADHVDECLADEFC